MAWLTPTCMPSFSKYMIQSTPKTKIQPLSKLKHREPCNRADCRPNPNVQLQEISKLIQTLLQPPIKTRIERKSNESSQN
ncbi:hypothetical protein FGO68_gene6535 [Halteria grandinella]|uniref:Uncharacterized protein n=1 Tax=Halteria grandinella TaxID=5974 RepID=A0A8J8SUU9_HALGN|nr:hypothetical protein FGO68_gene6535 [Halteria grandinella]